MILILIAIIAAVIVATALLWYSSEGYSGISVMVGALGCLMMLASGTAAVAYAFVGWSWFASEYKANVINREYGTNYTQDEIFWASNVIETVRQLDRKRIELNGNIMRKDDGR